MKIKKVSIFNFRGIEKLEDFELKNLSVLIGNNGTSKTAILEAINFCLSPHFLSGRIKHTDFFNGKNNEIKIILEFNENFKALLPDGYTKQEVKCNKVFLEVKKREKAAPNKAFSDIVVVSHYVVPNRNKDNKNGWEITRGTGTKFKFDERLLSFPVETDGLPKSFYFAKNRERQLQKGFNSSISSVFDDFNWRFNKGNKKTEAQETTEDQETFGTRKNKLEDEILNKIDDKSQKKTFETLNIKLQKVGLPNIKLSFIDGNAPFDSAFLSQKLDELDLSVSQLGSGVEMIVSLLFLETMAEISKESIFVLIDEPELHLHPKLQNDFVNHLIDFSDTNQILLSTHSPYFFKNCLSNKYIELLITKKDENNIITLENTGNNKFGLFKWSPSWGEINYFSYDLATIEFHNELYGYLESENKDVFNRITKSKKWLDDRDIKENMSEEEKEKAKKDVSLQTYVRHSIHHPENTNNQKFTDAELKQSIAEMIKLVNPNLSLKN